VYLSFAFFRFMSAYTVERLGQPLSIFLGAAGYLGFACAVALIGDFYVLCAAAVLWGLAASLFWSGSASYVLDWSQPGEYGRSSQRMYLGARTGVILGVVIQSAFIVRDAYGALVVFAAVTALAGTLAAVGLPRPDVHVARRDGGGLWPAFRALAGGEGALVALFLLFGAAVYGFFLALFVSFAKRSLGDSWWVMWVNFPFFVAAGFANLWSGSLSDRIGRRLVFLMGFASGASGLVMLAGAACMLPSESGAALAGAAGMILCASIFMGLQFATVPTVAMAWVGDHTDPGDRTRAYGITFAARDVGISGSILAAAYLENALSLAWAAVAFAAGSAVCAGLSLLIHPSPGGEGAGAEEGSAEGGAGG
jgi:MFS family permease